MAKYLSILLKYSKSALGISTLLILAILIFFQNCSSSNKFTSTSELGPDNKTEQQLFCEKNPSSVDCIVPEKPFCVFNGETIAEGKSVPAFAAEVVPKGSTCVSENRVCKNGQLSGELKFANCSEELFRSCQVGSVVLKHNEFANVYSVSSVPTGSVCPAPKLWTCFDGTLSTATGGNFSGGYFSCSPLSAPPPVTYSTCQEKGYRYSSWRSAFQQGFSGNYGPANGNEPAKYGTGWLGMTAYEGGELVSYDYWFCPN